MTSSNSFASLDEPAEGAERRGKLAEVDPRASRIVEEEPVALVHEVRGLLPGLADVRRALRLQLLDGAYLQDCPHVI